jgi:outer membrane translocation and assembly module TamA
MVSVVGFVDAVRASRRIDSLGPTRLHVDVGTGLRFDALGSGKVRVDIGYGLRDGRTRLSAGYVTPWGTR